LEFRRLRGENFFEVFSLAAGGGGWKWAAGEFGWVVKQTGLTGWTGFSEHGTRQLKMFLTTDAHGLTRIKTDFAKASHQPGLLPSSLNRAYRL
jgi:hypothetical protein